MSSSALRPYSARIRSRIRREAGVTLIELLIAMSIFAVVIGLIFQGVIAVQGMARDTALDSESVSELRSALAVIDRQVRSGNVLYSPGAEGDVLSSCLGAGTSGTCMRVYTQSNGDERCVQWQVVEDEAGNGTSVLRMRSWSPAWRSDGKSTDWATVARGLVTPTVADYPFSLQGGTTAYKSRLLQVRLVATDLTGGTNSDEIVGSIAGRNTNYGYDAGRCSPAPA